MKLSFQIAIRFLKSSLAQTLIIILGIGVGVSVQIFIGSLIFGLQNSLIQTTIGNSSHITITSENDEQTIPDYEDIIKAAKASDERITEASPAFDAAALLEKDGESQSLLIRGFEFDQAKGIYKVEDYLTEGKLPSKEGDVLLGIKAQEDFDLELGDAITLITPDRRTVECEISGFFDYKVSQINKSWCMTTLETAQTIFEADDVVSSIEFQVDRNHVFEADIVAGIMSDNIESDSELVYTNWKAENGQLLSGLQGQSISSLMIQVFVMISVSLGIASVLAITVMQKSRQVGILKAMGIQNFSSSLIFLFEGLILGIFGALAGVGLGLGLALAFTKFAVKPDGSPVVALLIDPQFIVISGAIAIGACILASMIPARKSSALNPIDIIRNG
jgi:lipoprotein-releasing system permease protein